MSSMRYDHLWPIQHHGSSYEQNDHSNHMCHMENQGFKIVLSGKNNRALLLCRKGLLMSLILQSEIVGILVYLIKLSVHIVFATWVMKKF